MMKLPSFEMLPLLLQASHRVLTDLNSVTGLCELLSQNHCPQDQQEYLLTVTNTIERITMLVKEIVSSSDLQGCEEIYESFRLMPLVMNCLDNTAFAREYHEVQLLIQTPFSETLELEGPQLAVHHCLLKCLQVLVPMSAGKKLVFNIAVDMKPFSLSPQKTRLQITMALEAVEITQLRQAFYQSDDLDVFLFHQQLKRAGLTLKIQSNHKRNNTAASTITLTGEYLQSDPGKQHVPSTVNQIQHILLVDDHALNNHILSKLLTSVGYMVYIASSGQEALTLWQKNQIDLILMDLHMPEMDGFETVSAIREIERQTDSHVPILALTAAYHYRYQAHCLASGFDAFLTKPIKLKQLLLLIDHLNTASKNSVSEKNLGSPQHHLDWYSLEQDLSATDPDLQIDLLQEILTLYLFDTKEILDQLEYSLASNILETALSLCHGLRGTSLNIHAQQMAETCHLLEKILQEKDPQNSPPESDTRQLLIDALFGQLCKAFEALRTEIHQHYPEILTVPRAG
ncbi:MAG: response regulator [Cyanobacteria bacterium]|nr:response regulator [Cyanobacteriota bacterium]